jgi:hypothetical protein
VLANATHLTIMRSNSMKPLICISIFIFGFLFGVMFGFNKGPEEFSNWDSGAKASIYASQNKLLKAGRVDEAITANEILLNAELARHGKHLDSQLFWLFKFTGPYSGTDKTAIERAVQYRLLNPYSEPDLSSPSNWARGVDINSEDIQTVIEQKKSDQKQMQKVIKLYAPK